MFLARCFLPDEDISARCFLPDVSCQMVIIASVGISNLVQISVLFVAVALQKIYYKTLAPSAQILILNIEY